MIDAKTEINQFQCRRCGKCCCWPGYVNVTQEEVEKIAEFLNLEIREFTEKYLFLRDDRRGLRLLEKDNGSCIFYEDSPPACIINSVKPQQCKGFPMKWNFSGWDDNCEAGILQKNKLAE